MTGDQYANITWPNSDLMDEWLVTPSVDMNAVLTFKALMSHYWMVNEAGAHLFVNVSTDDGVTWTQVWVEESFPTVFDNFE